jgi:hypothetical protein
MVRLCKYEKNIYGVLSEREVKVGDKFNESKVIEILEQRKSKGVFKKDIPFWAKIKTS